MNSNDVWLGRVRDDPRASVNILKVAAALVECAPDDGEFGIGGGGVYADEYLFQLADDLPEVRSVQVGLWWLREHGYLDIAAHTCDSRGSLLVCSLRN